ncbi:epsin-2 isoform X2 [Coregonus clupeaformis]|uniref:epsin-2 isoform X2 n=1 Tax=Coregonus clupeaformis TaxID=59861 RepID=UPI001E1C7827|nr:epsin-2 isoform X2 [Coregonus clupeaformis]
MPSSTIRRSVKNMVNNYSDAEKKVREATSNDPWGPSSSLMSEVADLTYNVVAFSEIMSMIWRRLNDHGKNWRHVYKALTLLDYLIKTGSERVALQCKENIFAIQTLKDFQYVDRDGKDQGINVRQKSKQLVVLLKDEERLGGERSQALKTKERMAQVTTTGAVAPGQGFGRGSSQPNLSTSYSEEYGKSEGSPASYHGSTSPVPGSELEQARPQTSGEEELQLQLALAMSREAAEQEERMRRGDDLRLQMALEESRKGKALGDTGSGKLAKKKREQPQSSLLDLMDVPERGSADPWGARGAAAPDPWQAYGAAPKPVAPVDPWGPPSSSVPPMKSSDPWGTNPAPDPWGSGGTMPKTSNTGDGRGLSSLTSGTGDLFDPLPSGSSRKTPESFLGPNAALVNLDSLVTKPPQPAPIVNPFLAAAGTDRMHTRYRTDLLQVQTGCTHGTGQTCCRYRQDAHTVQDRPAAGTDRMHTRYRTDLLQVQTGCTHGTGQTCCRYRQDAHTVQDRPAAGTDRMHTRYRTDLLQVQTGWYTRYRTDLLQVQTGCTHGTGQTCCRYRQDAHTVQDRPAAGTDRMHTHGTGQTCCRYRQDAHTVQDRPAAGTDRMHTRYRTDLPQVQTG